MFIKILLFCLLTLSEAKKKKGSKIHKGECGPSCEFKYFESNKTLLISGSGAMHDFHEKLVPWFDYRGGVEEIHVFGVTVIGKESFNMCTSAKRALIPDTVTKIDDYAFLNARSLKEINIPGSVETIGRYAFANCEQAVKLTLPNSVKTIEAFAFSRLYSLPELKIPNSVRFIGMYAFQHMKSITTVTLPDSLTEVSRDMFSECDKLENVILPKSIRKIGMFAFGNCRALVKFTVPEGVETIENGAFFSCPYLQEMHLPASLRNVGVGAFSYCEDINLVTFAGKNEPSYEGDPFDKSNENIKITVPSGYKGKSFLGRKLSK